MEPPAVSHWAALSLKLPAYPCTFWTTLQLHFPIYLQLHYFHLHLKDPAENYIKLHSDEVNYILHTCPYPCLRAMSWAILVETMTPWVWSVQDEPSWKLLAVAMLAELFGWLWGVLGCPITQAPSRTPYPPRTPTKRPQLPLYNQHNSQNPLLTLPPSKHMFFMRKKKDKKSRHGKLPSFRK